MRSFLVAVGYKDVMLTKSGPDQGIDLIAFKDGIDYGVQCKYYTNHVGNKAVQEAFAGSRFYGCGGAIVITNSQFTKQAVELTDSIGVQLVENATPELMENEIMKYERLLRRQR